MYLRQKQLQPNMTHAACCVSVQAVNFYSCVRAYLLSMKEAVRVVKVSVCVCVSPCFSVLTSEEAAMALLTKHTPNPLRVLWQTLYMGCFHSLPFIMSSLSLYLPTSTPILIFFAYHSHWLSVSIQSSCVTPSLCLSFFNPSVDQVVWPTVIGQCPYSRSGVTESSWG